MVFDWAWMRPLDFFDHPKSVRQDARVARSDCNVTLAEKYENPEFPWKRVHGKDSVWWHGSQETQKETQQ